MGDTRHLRRGSAQVSAASSDCQTRTLQRRAGVVIIHDLRHTAACSWLARGVDPVTVQAWLGHASIATTNIYLHHLGSSAGRAGLDRLNTLRGAGGARQAEGGE
ncbi:MAG: tyrosine-type recombinase/integrase [Nocardioidaceae bacterium]